MKHRVKAATNLDGVPSFSFYVARSNMGQTAVTTNRSEAQLFDREAAMSVANLLKLFGCKDVGIEEAGNVQ